jgi:uncharacterized DUF497 family protein
MDFEWDEYKRAQIIEDRALDFASAWRGEIIRVITMRRAHEQEFRKYRETYGG